MATYTYEDFRVTFSPRPDDTYDVHAIDSGGNAATGVFAIPLSASDLEHAVMRLAQTGTTRRAKPITTTTSTRDIGGSERPTVDAERLGGSLAMALLAGDIGTAYKRATERAERHGHGIRMTLSLVDAPRLLSVPWEFLYDRPRFLASQRRSPIVRLLETGALTTAPVIDAEVRILGVVASPRNLAPLDVDGERRRIEQALAPVIAQGQVRLDWLEPASPRSLRLALRDGAYHAIHYVGHSDFTADGNGVIFLEDAETGNAVEVDETLFANLLADQNLLRLVVLNSCEGARTSFTDPYAGVATTLVQLGVPAVVAMQFEISDRAAIVFAEELYTNLIGRRDPIDAAVAEARKAVYSDVDKVEWATPVLFMRDPEVELFRFGTPGTSRGDAPATTGQRLVDVPTELPRPWWLRLRLRPSRPVVAAVLVALAVAAAVTLRACADSDANGTTTTLPATTISLGGQPVELSFPSITVGTEGPTVVALQRLLTEKGFPIEATGFFDDATLAAVEQVEEASNIPVDGIVGRVTWQQLAAPIRRGDQGPAVLAAEELLQLAGFDIAPDERFTLDTQSDVLAFQRAHGFAADGIVDIDTWRGLLAVANAAPTTASPGAATSTSIGAPATSPAATTAPPVTTAG